MTWREALLLAVFTLLAGSLVISILLMLAIDLFAGAARAWRRLVGRLLA